MKKTWKAILSLLCVFGLIASLGLGAMAAEPSAEEIYAEWQAGAADEDSFAQLANLYSEEML